MKIITWFKKTIAKIKVEQVAIAAVMITQAIKRLATSEIGLLILDLAPLPWTNFIGKVLGWLIKIDKSLPGVIRKVVVEKDMLDEENAQEYKVALTVLIDHLRDFEKEDLNEFVAFIALEIIEANTDGKVTREEKKEIMEKSYKFLFKEKR